MKYGMLTYWTENLGDTIQSLAAKAYLPRLDRYLERDALATVSLPSKHLLICNAWWMHPRDGCFAFPFNDNIQPIFVSVHLAAKFLPSLSQRMIDYLAAHAPIGCRDHSTQRFLERIGIPCFLSRCLTLTLPTRAVRKSREVCLVDVVPELEKMIPEHLLTDAVRLTHTLSFPERASDVSTRYTLQRERTADRLLTRYARARLVITGRLHCALPSLALGTPVIFLFRGPSLEGRRLSALRGILPIYQEGDTVDWEPQISDIKPYAVPLRNLVTRAVYTRRNPVRDGARFPDDFWDETVSA